MADIFVSYSTAERELTVELARDLEAKGYSVWWDTSLITGDEFPATIRDEIRAAKAVVVIWTPNSVNSAWVYSEAQEAWRLGKLIPVRVSALEAYNIPLPFSSLHTDLVTDRERIYRAAEKFRAAAVPVAGATEIAVPIAPEAAAEVQTRRDRDNGAAANAHWTFAQKSGEARELRRFIADFPQSRKVAEAVGLLEELEWKAVRAAPSVARLERFMSEFPHGVHKEHARHGRDWLRARAEDSLSAYQDYLDAWPQGAHRADAETKLHEFLASRLSRSFTGHTSMVNSVAFSPDGRFALSGSHDKTLKLWDVGTAKELRSFTGHGSVVTSVAFSPDGRFALSGSHDATLKLWDLRGFV
jgi:TIR domain/WD domain, G-beta repeat